MDIVSYIKSEIRTIRDHVMISAGAVVLKEVPPNCTTVGVPGRIAKPKSFQSFYNSTEEVSTCQFLQEPA